MLPAPLKSGAGGHTAATARTARTRWSLAHLGKQILSDVLDLPPVALGAVAFDDPVARLAFRKPNRATFVLAQPPAEFFCLYFTTAIVGD